MWSNGRVTKWEEKVSAGGVGVGVFSCCTNRHTSVDTGISIAS